MVMKNVGMFTKKELNTLLKQFPKEANIEKTTLTTTVTHPASKKVILSAALIKTRNTERWHVRAVDGLLTTGE
jgi:lambda repressor-like predicted transcriptional regulator